MYNNVFGRYERRSSSKVIHRNRLPASLLISSEGINLHFYRTLFVCIKDAYNFCFLIKKTRYKYLTRYWQILLSPPTILLLPPTILLSLPTILLAPPTILLAPPTILFTPPTILLSPQTILLATPTFSLAYASTNFLCVGFSSVWYFLCLEIYITEISFSFGASRKRKKINELMKIFVVFFHFNNYEYRENYECMFWSIL